MPGRRSTPAGVVVSSLVAFAASGAAATGLSAGWYPLRSSQSNVEAALALVIVAAVAGVSQRRAAVAGAVVMAVIGFTYFDTQPYLTFQISRTPDLVTALLLLVVGLMTGETTRHTVKSRADERSATERLRRVQQAASRVARGEELAVLANSVAGEIEALLPGIEECWFSTDPPPPGTIEVSRDGEHPAVTSRSAGSFALPVWAMGRVIGLYLARPASALASAGADQLMTATALTDQVGAAYASQIALPPPPQPDGLEGAAPGPVLRVLRNP